MQDKNKKYLELGKVSLLVIVAVIIGLGLVCYLFISNNKKQYNSATQNSVTAKILFSDSSDFKNAYLISTDNYDAATQLAITGFKIDRKVLADGTQQINVIAQEPGYVSQSYAVKPGQKLYFVDRFLQDDQKGQEKNAHDDLTVLVGVDGYAIP